MGLYLCVFDGDQELEGVEVGSYADFALFRTSVSELLEGGVAGAVYPVLGLHSDCDGEWTPEECEKLANELHSITQQFQSLPAVEFRVDWQREVARSLGLRPSNFADSFIDVDGEPLLERLQYLCELAVVVHQPILFQ